MKTNKGILSDEELKERTSFWNKKQFRTWSKEELEKIGEIALKNDLIIISD